MKEEESKEDLQEDEQFHQEDVINSENEIKEDVERDEDG